MTNKNPDIFYSGFSLQLKISLSIIKINQIYNKSPLIDINNFSNIRPNYSKQQAHYDENQ